MLVNYGKYRTGLVLKLALVLIIACSTAGCSSMMQYIPFIGKKKPKQTIVKKLWSSGEQFVAIEKQDRQQGVTTQPNQHVSEISVDRIRFILESMEFRGKDTDKSYPLLNEDEVKILSEYIPVGLALAGQDEDVTFAVIGSYVEALGFLKKREVTTGRVFCKNGQLNIIFGDIHRELKETMGRGEDRRLNPFLPGSRYESLGEQEGTILPKQGGEIFAKNRQDWVVFQLGQGEAQPMATVQPDEEVQTKRPFLTNSGTLSPAPNERLTPPPAATAPAAAAAPQYAPPAQSAAPSYTAPAAPQYTGSATRDNRRYVGNQASQGAPAKNIEDRLTTLNNLRNKRLITEQEYRDKRMEILNEL